MGGVGGGNRLAIAPSASRSPAPTALGSKGGEPIGLAVLVCAESTSATVAEGFACNSRAATPAACGAAAEVPQKRQAFSFEFSKRVAKKVVAPQSVAVMSGLVNVSPGGGSGGAAEEPLTGSK